jgi:polyribonucleotide nucleotidyltransferase
MGKMQEVISKPSDDLSPHAPRLYTMTVPTEDIGTVIGPGGKMIRSIIEASGAEIDIQDDGKVTISSMDAEGANIAKSMIENLVFKEMRNKGYLDALKELRHTVIARRLSLREDFTSLSECFDFLNKLM